MTSKPGVQHILSLSYGKDSIACIFAIKELGWPLDRIMTADLWATDDIPADPPDMVAFKTYADRRILEQTGIVVEHYVAEQDGEKLTFEKVFYKKRTSSKSGNALHKIYGWPLLKGPWCNDRLKLRALRGAHKACENAIQYLGIAADEPDRILRHSKPNIKLPLVELGWDEAHCYKVCKDAGLLSPIYTYSARGGVLVLPQSTYRATPAFASEKSRFMELNASMG